MKNKKEIFILSISIIFVVIFIFVLLKNDDHIVLKNGKYNKYVSNNSLAMYLETGLYSSSYEMSEKTSWPGEGYVLNTTLSKCDNGGKVLLDEETNEIIISTHWTDKCYVYFNVTPPNIFIRPTYNGTVAVPANTGKNTKLKCLWGNCGL